jgi:Mrp family chromosome partitioning ATPase
VGTDLLDKLLVDSPPLKALEDRALTAQGVRVTLFLVAAAVVLGAMPHLVLAAVAGALQSLQ